MFTCNEIRHTSSTCVSLACINLIDIDIDIEVQPQGGGEKQLAGVEQACPGLLEAQPQGGEEKQLAGVELAWLGLLSR